ncbi:hypothetical protein SBA4_5890016 [Candidatus Sulfopaludibacter sp. SbA4]|nr:hypothetical protein SBA4_5890016 [Candidatus Sulfopaludibacter sp. SbA4]
MSEYLFQTFHLSARTPSPRVAQMKSRKFLGFQQPTCREAWIIEPAHYLFTAPAGRRPSAV